MVDLGQKKVDSHPPFFMRNNEQKKAEFPRLLNTINLKDLFLLRVSRSYFFPVHYIKKCIDIIWTFVLIF